jgi:cold shock CspA family protein
MTDTTYQGTCKWFGGHYGFLVPDDPAAHGGKDMFVHRTAVAGLRLSEGDRVSYTVETHDRTQRQCAANLKLI